MSSLAGVTHDVRRIALGLPGSYEHGSFGGRPSWRTKARIFRWTRDDPEALVVWVESIDDKEAFVAPEPDKFLRELDRRNESSCRCSHRLRRGAPYTSVMRHSVAPVPPLAP